MLSRQGKIRVPFLAAGAKCHSTKSTRRAQSPDATFVRQEWLRYGNTAGRGPKQDWQGLFDDFRNCLRSHEYLKTAQTIASAY